MTKTNTCSTIEMPASLRSENFSPSARNAARVPFGISVRLRRNPHLSRRRESGLRSAVASGLQDYWDSRQAAIEKHKKELDPLSIQPPPTPPPPPKDRDLCGEIKTVLFKEKRDHAFDRGRFYILFQVSLANHGRDELFVENWRLSVELNDSAVGFTESEAIPQGWTWKTEDCRETFTDLNSTAHKYSYGAPNSGWLLFAFSGSSAWGDGYGYTGIPMAPYNASFVITATDTLQNKHVITRKSQLYSAHGEIIS